MHCCETDVVLTCDFGGQYDIQPLKCSKTEKSWGGGGGGAQLGKHCKAALDPFVGIQIWGIIGLIYLPFVVSNS